MSDCRARLLTRKKERRVSVWTVLLSKAACKNGKDRIMERIESERLYLRPFGHGDAEAAGFTVRWRRLRATSTGNPIRRRMPAVLSNGMPGRCRARIRRGRGWGGAESYRRGDRGLCVLSGRRSPEIGCNISFGLSTPGLARERCRRSSLIVPRCIKWP